MFNILVVDDEKIVVSGIKKCLKLYHYPLEIFEANDGEEARQILENNKIDILMTDIELPLINGLDLIKIAKEYHPEIKTIVFSAYSNFEYARKAISLNAIYYLLKPINMQEFQEVMSTVVDTCIAEQGDEDNNLVYGKEEEELLFRDIFKNTAIDEDVINNISFFNKVSDDTLFCLCYFKFSDLTLKGEQQKFDSFIKRNIKSCRVFKIDDMQCVIAVRYSAINEFKCYDLYLKIIDWFKENGEKTTVFAVCAEQIENVILIYREIEQIKHLKELHFYFDNKNIFLRTDSSVKTFSPTIDTKVLLDAIERDITEKNFTSLQTNIGKLIEVLGINKQLSPMYVKYIFFDIVKKIQNNIPEISETKLSINLEKIANASKIEEITNCMSPLLETLIDLDKSQYTHNHRIVEQLLDYIHHNYSKALSLDSLSEMVFLSPAYTSTIFKQVTNQTITNYINGYRMKKAKKLLVETNMKLVDIYPLVGYSSLTYFCVLFKNMFGETPSQYRRKKRKRNRRLTMKKILAVILSLALVIGCMPNNQSIVKASGNEPAITYNNGVMNGMGLLQVADGDYTTGYCSEDNPDMSEGAQYIQFAWPQEVKYNSVTLFSNYCGTAEKAGQAPTKWVIQTSSDGVTYTDAATVTSEWNDSDGSQSKTAEFALTGSYKYMRIVIQEANLNWAHYVITEIEFSAVNLGVYKDSNDTIQYAKAATITYNNSVMSGMGLLQVADGDYATGYVSEDNPNMNDDGQYIQYSWNAPIDFNLVTLYSKYCGTSEKAGQAPTEWKIQVSKDGTSFTDVCTVNKEWNDNEDLQSKNSQFALQEDVVSLARH